MHAHCYVSNHLQLATIMSSLRDIAEASQNEYALPSDLGEGVAAPGNEIFRTNFELHLAKYPGGVAAFAKAVGRSQSTISLWRSGAREPNLETIGRIAQAFKIPLMELFVDATDPASIKLTPEQALRVLDVLVQKDKKA